MSIYRFESTNNFLQVYKYIFYKLVNIFYHNYFSLYRKKHFNHYKIV